MTALSESFSMMIICDVFPLPISTFWLFSQIVKSVLDTCHNHKAVNAVNTHQNNLESTGIGACACARHWCFVPHSVVDFQKGERSVMIKERHPRSINHTSQADQHGLLHLQCFGIPHRAHELCLDHLRCGLPVVY